MYMYLYSLGGGGSGQPLAYIASQEKKDQETFPYMYVHVCVYHVRNIDMSNLTTDYLAIHSVL